MTGMMKAVLQGVSPELSAAAMASVYANPCTIKYGNGTLSIEGPSMAVLCVISTMTGKGRSIQDSGVMERVREACDRAKDQLDHPLI